MTCARFSWRAQPPTFEPASVRRCRRPCLRRPRRWFRTSRAIDRTAAWRRFRRGFPSCPTRRSPARRWQDRARRRRPSRRCDLPRRLNPSPAVRRFRTEPSRHVHLRRLPRARRCRLRLPRARRCHRKRPLPRRRRRPRRVTLPRGRPRRRIARRSRRPNRHRQRRLRNRVSLLQRWLPQPQFPPRALCRRGPQGSTISLGPRNCRVCSRKAARCASRSSAQRVMTRSTSFESSPSASRYPPVREKRSSSCRKPIRSSDSRHALLTKSVVRAVTV